jgi:hypothetical protein
VPNPGLTFLSPTDMMVHGLLLTPLDLPSVGGEAKRRSHDKDTLR